VIPFGHDALDAPSLARFCELTVERQALRADLETRGNLLEEPIVTPLGNVVGERVVLNPAIPALRAIDRALDALADRLGLNPVSRARLGLTLSDAAASTATAERLLEGLTRD
jgi:phage terminase small subunit